MATVNAEKEQVSKIRRYGTYGLLAVAYTLVLPGICLPQLHLRTSFEVTDLAEAYLGATAEENRHVAWITQVLSYLTDTLLTEHETGFFRIVKSLIKLGGVQYVTVAVLITTWGVIVPFIKFVTLMLYLSGAVKSRNGVALVSKLSKWSLVDAFLPLVCTGIVMMPTGALIQYPEVNLSLKAGFYCFLGHCLLAQVVHHLVLYLPFEGASEPILDASEVRAQYSGIDVTPRSPRPLYNRPVRAFTAIASVVILLLLSVAVALPSMEFYNRDRFPYREASLLQLIESVGSGGFMVPAVILFVFCICFPAMDLLLSLAEALALWQRREKERMLIESFCMLDVLMVTIAIAVLAAPGILGGSTLFRVYPQIVTLGVCAIAWGLRAVLRPSTTPPLLLEAKAEDP